MKVMTLEEMRAVNGGATYKCKHCSQSWTGKWPFKWLAKMQRDNHQKYCMAQF